ncbi:hypothetical protein PO883_21340 [Massilia sp. DJPM01]|uniref:DarT1-associated NADAR antitoxin family protein n=1 Tax=Massilia sp. DJPM01 TaxID=3024404 RepID=UPI00259ED01F|nr:hypothetical protein [Massilia sp. DJPM01]MDM5179740.1 hypothetical protein [Massilia sp. DJPM01]
MAVRPLFVAKDQALPGVEVYPITFQWFAGLSTSQKRKSIAELHSAAVGEGRCSRPLEISSQSENPLGVALSAFNLQIVVELGLASSVESVFQSSKYFDGAGPFRDLLRASAREAKKDERLRNSGMLRGFNFGGREWPLLPRTVFYDWLYIAALQESNYCDALLTYDGFTDIEFNPAKSVNCQAQAAAVFVSLSKTGEIFPVRNNPDRFLEVALRMEHRAI